MLRVLFELSKIMKIVEKSGREYFAKIPKRARRMSLLFPKALPIGQNAELRLKSTCSISCGKSVLLGLWNWRPVVVLQSSIKKFHTILNMYVKKW
jgi:hypothetical protein